MVRAYWSMTPETTPELAERFIAHVLAAEQRSREWLDLAVDRPTAGSPPRWLDIGCGTADLAVAAGAGVEVVGIDVAFRWLMLARRRLMERGLPVRLICANATALPFAEGTFDRALSLGVFEHCRDLPVVLREAHRVLTPGGRLHARTVNRFSALPEPHIGVWGVGWIPRRWADRYTRLITGRRYRHHWPRSAGELRRALKEAGFADARVYAAPVLNAEIGRRSPRLRRAASVYQRLRRAPLMAVVCRWFAPLLELEARVH
jgi:ubiquinone/menaquinone biosynthesis C-methylase UbiE